MKYYITGSRLEKLILNYLDEIFSELKEHKEKILDTEYIWWGNGYKKVVEMGDREDGVLSMGIDEDTWLSVKQFFKLSPITTDVYFTLAIHKNLGYNPVEIYIF